MLANNRHQTDTKKFFDRVGPYRVNVVLTVGQLFSNQQAPNFLRKVRTASTASTTRAAYLCVPICVSKTYRTPPYTFTRNFLRNTPCWWGLCPLYMSGSCAEPSTLLQTDITSDSCFKGGTSWRSSQQDAANAVFCIQPGKTTQNKWSWGSFNHAPRCLRGWRTNGAALDRLSTLSWQDSEDRGRNS